MLMAATPASNIDQTLNQAIWFVARHFLIVIEDTSCREGMEFDLGLDESAFSARKFSSSDEALDALREYCHSLGFSLKKKRDNKAQTKDCKATIFYFVCGRAGVYKNYRPHLTEENRLRDTKTRLCGCQFKASVRAASAEWVVQFDYTLHNHESTTNLKSLRHARSVTAEHELIIKTMADAGASVRATLAAINSSDPSSLLIDRDIMNTRRRLLESELNGQREMQVLVDELRIAGVKHAVRKDEDDNCTHLLVHPQSAEELTLEFHDLVQMDSTYRTNRYNMPLLHIVGCTNTNKSFTMATCFMRSEKTEDYLWALEALRRLVGERLQPQAISTDRELALVNAVGVVFPRARHILCAWHIGKNILAKCKKLFPVAGSRTTPSTLLSWEEFSLKWSMLVLRTLDREEFCQRWSDLKAQIPTEARDYIEYQWMTPWKERFCATFLQDVRHFGGLTTSRVEGCHAALKSWIPNASMSLRNVYKAVERHCARQLDICITEREIQRQSVPLSIRSKDFFKAVQTIVSHQALKIVNNEYEKALQASTVPCNNYLSSCYGLPCSHTLREVIRTADAHQEAPRLRFDHFDSFWLLDKTKTAPLPRTDSVLSPQRIANPRGGPRGKKRLPSEFEHVERPAPVRKCGFCNVPAHHNRATCPLRIKDIAKLQ